MGRTNQGRVNGFGRMPGGRGDDPGRRPRWPAVISVCAILKAAGCLGGWTFINAEAALAAARDGLFPKAFAKTDRRGAPVLGLVLVSVLMTAILLATLSPEIGAGFTVLADISVLLVLTPYIFAAVAVSYYVRAGIIPRSVVWAALLTVCYCLTVVATSAGTAVAISMVLGLVTAPLFGALIAVQARRLKLNPADD